MLEDSLPAIVADTESAAAFARIWLPPAIVTRTLGTCGGDAVEDTRRLSALLGDIGWLTSMLAEPLAVIADAPFAQPPFRGSGDATGRLGLQLARCARVALTLSVQPPAPDPPHVLASGRISVTRIVCGGGAMLETWACGKRTARCAQRVAAPEGTVLALDGGRRALRFVGQGAPLVTLTATLTPAPGALARRYSVDDGRLVATHAAAETGPRMQMLLALLGASGGAGHAETYAQVAADPDPQVRWAAMRTWLRHDAAAAADRLTAMADTDPDPAVRVAAAATWTTLGPRLAA